LSVFSVGRLFLGRVEELIDFVTAPGSQ